MNERQLALSVIEKTLERGGQSHRLLQECFRAHPTLEPRKRGFITQLVHGTLSCALLLDHYLAQVSSLPPEKMKPFIRHLLRMSLYQLLFMDRVPANAVCDEAVKLTRRRLGPGLTGFVNALLRTAAQKKDWQAPEGAAALSLPEPLYDVLIQCYGPEKTEQIGRAYLEAPALWGRMNLSRCDASRILSELEAGGWQGIPSPHFPQALRLERKKEAKRSLPLEDLALIQTGLLQLQDISSQLAVLAAEPGPGMQVLDLCAAPGGKSLHAADLMKNQGRVLACDISEAKRKMIEENTARSGFSCVESALGDALIYDPGKEAAFDLVLADLPCSGLGVAARKPEIKYRAGSKQIQELAALQRRMLQNAIRYVKPGGRLLFSTCTITREENLDNALWLEQQGLKPLALSLRLPEEIKRDTPSHMLQLLPGDLGGDGFFISLFVRG